MNPRQAVFLDRDGVINRTVFRRGAQRAPADLSEFVFVDGVHETLETLRQRGYLLVVCTNQPDVVRGWQTREQVEEFHRLIVAELPITKIYACYHDRHDDCSCRKPNPGMLLSASRDFGIDLSRSWMIGDRSSDIEAGRAAGCATVFVRNAHNLDEVPEADHEVRHLPELLAWIE